MITRRTFGAASLASALFVFCKREERCAACGMKLREDSPWRSEVQLGSASARHFDTPRCALEFYLHHRSESPRVRVQEYYRRTFEDASELRFVVGSDVLGPMGPDLVPVAPTRAEGFVREHGGARVVGLGDVTLDLLEHLP